MPSLECFSLSICLFLSPALYSFITLDRKEVGQKELYLTWVQENEQKFRIKINIPFQQQAKNANMF